MTAALRYVAVATAGATAFLDMYSTQPLLPVLRQVFHASEPAVAATITSLTLAVALSAPLIGPLADTIGRKRVIVTAIFLLAVVTFAASHARTLGELVAWRFVQGLAMPGIFVVTLSYIAEEFPLAVAGRAVAAYIGGNVLGGFLGRYVSAVVAERSDWQVAFATLGALGTLGGLVVLAVLPPASNFTRKTSFVRAFGEIGRFMRMPRMLAAYTVGASILFSLVAAFTYATFYLSAPPFSLGTAAIGNVFFVYLAGAVATPLSGFLIDRIGNRAALVASLAFSVCGVLVTLVPSVAAVVVGLAVMSTGVFVAQASSQGFVARIAGAGRSTAAGLYLTFYYVGGGAGALAPAKVWALGGWTATVVLVVVVELFAAALAGATWTEPRVAAAGSRR